METKPLPNLLDREFAVANNREIIDVACELLKKLVNNATNVFGRCLASQDDEIDYTLLFSYLHMIEMTDGIEILVSQSSLVPAAPLLRSSYEALLSIEYILENDYEKRAKSWLVGFFDGRESAYGLLDEDTDKGRKFLSAFKKEIKYEKGELPNKDDIKSKIEDLRKFLCSPKYIDVQQEWPKTKKGVKKKVPWFSLYGGPRNIRKLAIHLNKESLHDVLYSQWSSITHARDMSRFWGKTERNQWGIYSLRNPSELKRTVSLASSFLLDATYKVLSKFRKGEAFNATKWYFREVREAFRSMDP